MSESLRDGRGGEGRRRAAQSDRARLRAVVVKNGSSATNELKFAHPGIVR